ncbi:MAG TPA: FecR domain-containing protein [Polyangia bacterium]|jgi:ferric-dicitrate binding protein FerR (iron transport regulator)|nr:FecR domain-containing protein [Polyangia bacterium]
MALGCREAGRISLATLGGHADEAERLELEAHLTGCARCDQDHAALGLMRSLRAVPTATMSAAARESVRRAVAAHRVRAVAPQRRLVWPFAAATVGACAVVALALVTWRSQPYRIVQGDVTVSSSAVAGAGHERGWSFHSMKGGTIRVGEATTELAQRTDVAWTPAERTLTLANGVVTVDVEHQEGRRFRVRTPRFIVEVMGTRFTVELSGVRTQRGLVRILRPDGTQIARVEAGQSWSDQPVAERPSLTTPLTTPPLAVAPVGPPNGKVAAPPGAIAARALATGMPVTRASTANRLAEARHLLSRGDAAAARRLAATLFRQRGELAVEARVLFAESFLVEGRYADAVDAYRVVARDFPRSEQAETSLFTVAQLEGEHGRPADSRAALRAYVSRYPHGRFAREAGTRLSRLSSGD